MQPDANQILDQDVHPSSVGGKAVGQSNSLDVGLRRTKLHQISNLNLRPKRSLIPFAEKDLSNDLVDDHTQPNWSKTPWETKESDQMGAVSRVVLVIQTSVDRAQELKRTP